MLARNPWVALDVATDPVLHARLLRRVYEKGALKAAADTREMRELVVRSWERSVAAGVSPDAGGAPLSMSGSDLEAARTASGLAPAIDAILEALSDLDADARHVIAIGDAQANLLWVTGDASTVERAQEMRFQEGSSWSEAAAGTNALGIATALDHPVQVFSAEHFLAAVHGWTCSAAPIHDPATGELIGVVDLTADLRTAHPHTLSVALLAARAAEAALNVRLLESVAQLRDRWRSAITGHRTPNALLDPYGRVIATRGGNGLPRRLELDGGFEGEVGLADGRAGELEALEGGGAILWLRPRAGRGRPVSDCVCLGTRRPPSSESRAMSVACAPSNCWRCWRCTRRG